MADWTTIASLSTAAGTLVLAAATFSSVRSANRAARVTEVALNNRLRPLLLPTRLDDPEEKVGFADQHWVRVPGGAGTAEVSADAIWLTMSLRNVGNGIAVLDRWALHTEAMGNGVPVDIQHSASADFRRLTRDLYIAPGDRGFWQGAIRDTGDSSFGPLREAIETRQAFRVELLYSDYEGGQRIIGLFGFIPAGEDRWLIAAARHWNLDRDDPR